MVMSYNISTKIKKTTYPKIKTLLDQRNDFKKYVYAFVLHCITHSAPGPYHSNVDNYIYLHTFVHYHCFANPIASQH